MRKRPLKKLGDAFLVLQVPRVLGIYSRERGMNHAPPERRGDSGRRVAALEAHAGS